MRVVSVILSLLLLSSCGVSSVYLHSRSEVRSYSSDSGEVIIRVDSSVVFYPKIKSHVK